MTKGPLIDVARKSVVRMPLKAAIAVMMVYILLGVVCAALGVILVKQALELHTGGRVVEMTLTSGIVIFAFGIWRIALSVFHLVKIRRQIASRR